jgi:HAD superfamily hydrolase (TIGR01549 family)
MTNSIKHVWFDMDGTLTVHTEEFDKVHDDLRYKTYASVVGRQVDDELIREYEELYKKHGSNSAVFTSLGKPSDFWMQYFDQLDQTRYYEPIPEIYETLDKLRTIVPISLFTNARLANTHKTLEVVNVNADWFTHIVSGDDIANRKPALDGFHLMIEKSAIPAQQILYVGDRVNVDVKPAKAVDMKACLVYSKSDEADYSFESFDEVLRIFE